jgi:signal transduction histidine kinase
MTEMTSPPASFPATPRTGRFRHELGYLLGGSPVGVAAFVVGGVAESAEAPAELRALSRGIAPGILADRVLVAALAAAAARCPVPVSLSVEPAHGRRFDPAVENIAYFAASGAHPGKGHGLAGLRDRLAAVEGSLAISSPAGGPTVLTAEIPLSGLGGS